LKKYRSSHQEGTYWGPKDGAAAKPTFSVYCQFDQDAGSLSVGDAVRVLSALSGRQGAETLHRHNETLAPPASGTSGSSGSGVKHAAPAAAGERVITKAELAAHCTDVDLWMAVEG
jgi:hypothetical protein